MDPVTVGRNPACCADQDCERDAGEPHSLGPDVNGASGRHQPIDLGRIWCEACLKLHRVDTLNVFNDPQFKQNVADDIGFYANTLDKVFVLCIDERNRIQAIDRKQPGLPMKRR